ncbi:MAG: oligosaccharide flippase family protein, partial [Elusimicrobiota bacterium]
MSDKNLFDSRSFKSDLAGKSVRGGLNTIAAQAVQAFIRIGGSIILARLLTPADYGLVGMVTVLVNFISIFRYIGLSNATIQKEHITRELISTLFWINLCFT